MKNFSLFEMILSIVAITAITSTLSAKATSDELYIGVGHIIYNGEEFVGHVGYRKNGFELEVGLFGYGETDRGFVEEPIKYYSIAHVVRSQDPIILGGKLTGKLGVAYVDDHPLVGNVNYMLGLGLSYKYWEISIDHISSAGINENNKGLTYPVINVIWAF